MKKIKSGVVGIGFIGAAHVEALRRLGNVDVIAIAHSNEEKAKAKAEELDVDTYYSDYNNMVNNPDIDCIHICTPNYLHYEMVKKALEAGKHVVCEKPLTTNVDEARELVELAREKDLVNAINFNLRFYPLVHQLKYVIEKGEIGKIFSIHGSYLQDWLFYNTDYNWRLEPELSGDSRAVADIGSHWMDLVEFVTGLTIIEVLADFATFHKVRKKPLKPVETYAGKILTPEDYRNIPIDTEDYATILLGFDNGARGAVTISQVFAGRKNRLNVEIAGSKKSAVWESERPNEIWFGRRDTVNEHMIKDPSLMYQESRQLVSYPGGHNEGFPDTMKQNFKKIYDKISGKNPKVQFPTFEAGLREVYLCEKIVESSKTKTWVKV